jgi:hypothetical protein
LLPWSGARRGAGPGDNGVTFATRRGPLDIKVVEGGSIPAREFPEIKCEVRVGYQGLKILRIVEEGYQVTDEDIRTNKVLVELDSRPPETDHPTGDPARAGRGDAHGCAAGLRNPDQPERQRHQAAEQKARFARMEFAKFMGAETADAGSRKSA